MSKPNGPEPARRGPAADAPAAGPGEAQVAAAPGPLDAIGPADAAQPPSTAILTAPNAISSARLLLMPVCAWQLGTGHYAIGLWLTAVVGSTDWVDGWLARRTGRVSRLGQLLDPLADRLLIASVAVALVVRGVLPLLAVALLVGRDVLLLAGFPLLRSRGVRPPDVVWVGKAATFDLLLALPVLVVGETHLALAPAAHVIGLILLWAGVVLYYVAGVVYVRMALEGLRAARASA
ncbi:MAG TPA: CDP-alcohol phosphatidyltransferase family protein [Actinomycetota bacterium]|nr:CDP-alcohol phosphatidyltransferase family protein [Actinomycetota bacterium]